MHVVIDANKPPVGIAFDVSLRAGGRTQSLGPVAWSSDTELSRWSDIDIDVPPDIATIELVFTPSVAAAARLKRRDAVRLMGLNSIWTGEALSPGGPN